MNRPEIRTLERMVAAPTVSNRPMIELAAYVAQRAEDQGFRVELQEDPDRPGKANVLAFAGPDDMPGEGLMLSGHLDVVPVEGQEWSSDPFTLTAVGDRLVGRGSSDMKGFIAAAITGLDDLDVTKLSKPLVLAWTHDEEVGCVGSARIASLYSQDPRPLPKECWIGEPTDFQIFRMHPGHVAVELEVRGVSAHSSKPDLGASAIKGMMRLIEVINGLEADLMQERRLERYLDRPYVTLNAGTLSAGSAVNMVPDRAVLRLGYRPLPGDTPDALQHRLRERLENTSLPKGCTWTMRQLRATPAMLTPEGIPLQGLLEPHCCGGEPAAASFATDGGNLADLGVSSLIFGPGSIDVAHAPDEYVEVRALSQAVGMVQDVVRRRCFGS
ncbi:MAG: acetylornithine deacetylase [Myxococcota bacterium]|nr:acetylornithine deacetylase [Myxococcota bacterium]